MEILRKTKKYHLNKGNSQAAGLFNVATNDDEATGLSLWFSRDTKNELLALSNSNFDKRCKELIEQNDY